MTYTQEFDIDNFPFWAGAKDVIAEVKKHNKMDELQSFIEDYFADQTPTKTQINDFVWFQRDFIFSNLGIKEEDNA